MRKNRIHLLFLTLIVSINLLAQDPSIVYPYVFKAPTTNPLITYMRTADPSAKVMPDGKLWLYPSHDPDNGGNNYDGMDGYHVYSTTDLETWTDYGEVLHSRDVEWNGTGSMWAPDCAYKNGKYYFYFPSTLKSGGQNFRTGVAVSDKPQGPFIPEKDFIQGTTGIDPMCFIDDDGQAYLYFGYTANPFVAKLKDNMIELAESMRRIDIGDASAYVEGSFMHKYNGKYYLSWSNFRGYTVDNKKYGALYAVGDSPYGPFEFKGGIKENPPGAQDHHSIVEFNGQWYIFYHVGNYNGGNTWRRNVCVDYLYHNPDGTIKLVPKSTTAMVAKDLFSSTNGNEVPGTFNASQYYKQQGITTSGTTIASLNNFDYAEYIIEVIATDTFELNLEFENITNNGSVEVYVNSRLLSTIPVAPNATKLSSLIPLQKGKFLMKLLFRSEQAADILNIMNISIASGYEYYKITPTRNTGGVIIPDTEEFYRKGSKPIYNFKPNLGFRIKDVLVNGVSQGNISSYVFDSINTNNNIEVQFEACTATINPFYKLDNDEVKESSSIVANWGQVVTLLPEGNEEGVWSWIGPNNFESTQQSISFKADFSSQGKYILNYTTKSGCSSYVEINVEVVHNGTSVETAYKTFQAEEYNNASAGLKIDSYCLKHVGQIDGGEWIMFKNLDFAKTNARCIVNVTSGVTTSLANTKIEIRTGAPTGPIIGEIVIPITGGWCNYRQFSTEIAINGLQDIFIVFVGSADQFDVDWIKFEPTTISDVRSVNYLNAIIYPNPAKGYVNILMRDDYKDATLEITNLLGQRLLSKKLTSERTLINIENFTKMNILIFNIRTEGRTYTKLIKTIN